MEKINRALGELVLRKGDLYIFDYTEHTKKWAKEDRRKVELHEEDPGEINGLSILNPKQVEFYSANIEHPDNERLFVHPKTKVLSPNCETICFAAPSSDDMKLKRWIIFAELKYCLKKNEPKNLRKAYNQLFESRKILSRRGGVDVSKYRSYFILSLPDNSETPFDGFIYGPDDVENIKVEHGVTLIGTNTVEIISKSRIR